MVRCAAAINTEEDQIAFLQRLTLDRRGVTQVIHLVSGTRDLKFHQVFIGIPDQTAAIETGMWRGAAPLIGFTQLPHQLGHCSLTRLLIALAVGFAHFNRAWLAGGDLSGFQLALMPIAFLLFIFFFAFADTGGFERGLLSRRLFSSEFDFFLFFRFKFLVRAETSFFRHRFYRATLAAFIVARTLFLCFMRTDVHRRVRRRSGDVEKQLRKGQHKKRND